jgi:hypothetical protein
MASEAQIQANRVNAQKSTGPRSAAGKAVVAQNALKHGLAARLEVIRGEDQAEFDRLREEMLEELAPAGARQIMLAERVVGLSWRLDRAGRLQNEVFDALLGDRSSPLARSLLPERTIRGHEGSQAEGSGLLARSLLAEGACRGHEKSQVEGSGPLTRSLLPEGAGRTREEWEAEPELTRGQVVLEDFSHGRVLDRLLLYERRIERSFYNAMGELRDLQRVGGTARVPAGAAPPAGRADGAPVRDELRRTDPTSRLRIGDCGLRTERSRAGTPNPFDYCPGQAPQGGEMRRTKPIGTEPERGQAAGGQGVAANARASAGCETKPISPEPAAGLLACAQSRNDWRGTNPIPPQAERGHLAGAQGLDELRRTKPIRAEPEGGQVAGAQGVAANLRASRRRETKPISARGSRTSNIRSVWLRALMGTP